MAAVVGVVAAEVETVAAPPPVDDSALVAWLVLRAGAGAGEVRTISLYSSSLTTPARLMIRSELVTDTVAGAGDE